RVDDPGGDWRFAHHPVRGAEPRTAPGAAFVADVLRAVHRRRIVLFDPPAGGENPSRAIPDRSPARAADPPAVWCDVLLAVEGPRPPCVAGPADVARPTMPDDTLDDSLRVDQRAKRTVGRLAGVMSLARIDGIVASGRFRLRFVAHRFARRRVL